MTTDNWQQFKDVFQSALELPESERPAYLDRVCAEPSFRKEVESLLDCYTGKEDEPRDRSEVVAVSDLIDEPSTAANTDGIAKTDSLVETFIDQYQIAAKISAPGQVQVFRAIRIDAPDQQVAIMLLKTGAGNEEFLRWFNKERLILLKLRHPNIASLLGTGFDRDGEPYLVLEYVEGLPIGEYCNSNKLNTKARITLFLEVCRAIQYAHQHLIAHGSLDSGSVLIDKEASAKVLNLGIANLRGRESIFQGGGSSAKPEVSEFASPERIRGEPITTGADVYSLGVLFYQLLTGHSPYRIKSGSTDELLPALFEPAGPSQSLRQISEETRPDGKKNIINPHYLSSCRNERVATIRKRLAGDLDSVMLKAIQRDAAKRYYTVEQFCGDIHRYLELQPVSARKNTFPYRVNKFITRHKAGVIAAAVGMTAILAAIVMMMEGLLVR